MCELWVSESASWKFANHIFWKKEFPVKDASDTYLSRVKHWHVTSLGIILSKACDNKGGDMSTFYVCICQKLGFLMTWLRWIK